MPSEFSLPSPAFPDPWINLGGPTPCQFNRIDLPIRDLPSDLAGVRILHISDPHFRSRWSEGWSQIIEQINSANADLILMTGDFVDSKTKAAPALPCVERFFTSLRSRLGNYAIFGNHDHDFLYHFAHRAAQQGAILPEPWPRRRRDSDGEPRGLPIPPRLPAMEIFGHRILDDRREVLSIGNSELELIGFRGTSRGDFGHDFFQSLPPKSPGSIRIILSHHPDSIRHLRSAQPDLVLAGHTHGGQICLPGHRAILSHDSLPKRCASGLHKFGDTWLLVSRGLGFSSIPIRLFCPPEMTQIKLETLNDEKRQESRFYGAGSI